MTPSPRANFRGRRRAETASLRSASAKWKSRAKLYTWTDKQEFYQLLTYTGDVDLNAKLAEWERFYNYQRPHGAFRGKTPYEALREKLG